ncbi:hypothetical protein [Bradyrhizobium sp. Arg816]|uniref:hypothetical protein n=1 Tax=Bradyrhizobium sp. Arg816 TaxID=2998491 RepID=UPI00249DAB66|nr:hypothetical protein [Bradyrhizobium sp. Arg816]MDI3560244.1 hypothetical protein [Bradyrhizobium sp. Arg816]
MSVISPLDCRLARKANIMRTSIALQTPTNSNDLGALLARRGTDLILAVEDGNALIRCHVSSATAAAMLAPLKGRAAGLFRALSGNLVEIDAAVTLATAIRMLEAKAAAESRHLN